MGAPIREEPARGLDEFRGEGTLHVGDVFDGDYWTALYTLQCTAAERSLLASHRRN